MIKDFTPSSAAFCSGSFQEASQWIRRSFGLISPKFLLLLSCPSWSTRVVFSTLGRRLCQVITQLFISHMALESRCSHASLRAPPLRRSAAQAEPWISSKCPSSPQQSSHWADRDEDLSRWLRQPVQLLSPLCSQQGADTDVSIHDANTWAAWRPKSQV